MPFISFLLLVHMNVSSEAPSRAQEDNVEVVDERRAHCRFGHGETRSDHIDDAGDIDSSMFGRRRSPDLTLTYGHALQQRVGVYRPRGTPATELRPPLAVFIHGGGWRSGDLAMLDHKPAWFRQHGWWFASVGYRLRPRATVDDQLADVVASIRLLRASASSLGYDPNRILLLGHNSGAHIAAMLASDQRLLGDDFSAIRGAILLDGAAYDVPSQILASPRLRRRIYQPAFSSDPQRQQMLSPITYTSRPNVLRWLVVFSHSRCTSPSQATTFGHSLSQNGATVGYLPISIGHLAINRDFGHRSYIGNSAVEAMMEFVASEPR